MSRIGTATDLVRDGIDGFRSQPVGLLWHGKRQSPGWQQLLGLEPYPKVAGALAQLVQVDTQAAEAACLTCLPVELRRAMGAAARQRAWKFHPERGYGADRVVISEPERRQKAVRIDFFSPQLIWFARFSAMHPGRH